MELSDILPQLATLADAARLVQQNAIGGNTLYVRCCDPDDDRQLGRSRNHHTGEFEYGLSALLLTPDVLLRGEPRTIEHLIVHIAERVKTDYRVAGRSWVVSGSVVGTGSDGEPLLKEVEYLAVISFQAVEDAGEVTRAKRLCDAAAEEGERDIEDELCQELRQVVERLTSPSAP